MIGHKYAVAQHGCKLDSISGIGHREDKLYFPGKAVFTSIDGMFQSVTTSLQALEEAEKVIQRIKGQDRCRDAVYLGEYNYLAKEVGKAVAHLRRLGREQDDLQRRVNETYHSYFHMALLTSTMD